MSVFGVFAMVAFVVVWGPLSAGAQGVPGTATGPLAGKRVIFDETFQFWTTREAADRTLSKIKAGGFTVYIPVVWYGAGATWPSRLAPWDPAVASQVAQGFDPLRYVVERAHAMGIEVYAWFTVALRRSDLFPDLALEGVRERGELGIFDIHNPRFRETMAGLIAEVARNYDIDGINLDYIRAMGLCTSAACSQEYRVKYGRDLSIDAVTFRLAPGLVPTLIDYQESTVTELVRTIATTVRAVKPRLTISAAAFPELKDAMNGANSVDWVNRGHIDVLFRMDYAKKIDGTSTEAVRARMTQPDRLTILAGNYDLVSKGAEPRSGQWLVNTFAEIENRWPRTGTALYLFNQLSDEQVSALKRWDARKTSGGPGTPADVRVH